MKTGLLLIDIAVKLLIAIAVLVWVGVIFTLATSGISMIRQLLGCMFTTMAIYGVLLLALTGLKRLKSSLLEKAS